jgi:hypothetical protein
MPSRTVCCCLHISLYRRPLANWLTDCLAGRGYKPAPDTNRTAPSAIRTRPGQFAPSPRNRKLRRGGSNVSRAGREESRPLSGPRQIAVRAMYRIPPITRSAPSPIRNILASLSVAAPHNTTGLKHPGSKTFRPSAAIQQARRMGGAQRYPSLPQPQLMGIAALHPSYGLRLPLRTAAAPARLSADPETPRRRRSAAGRRGPSFLPAPPPCRAS